MNKFLDEYLDADLHACHPMNFSILSSNSTKLVGVFLFLKKKKGKNAPPVSNGRNETRW